MSKKQLLPYTHVNHIKNWLEKTYTHTDKNTFISVAQLFDEFDSFMEKKRIRTLDFEVSSLEEYETLYKEFWVNLRVALNDLNWPVEENFIYYANDGTEEVTENSYKIQGIFHLLKNKDVNKNIIEAPKDRILMLANRFDYDEKRVDKKKDSCDLFDFRAVEERSHSRRIDNWIAGKPESNEFSEYPWFGYPAIYSHWQTTLDIPKQKVPNIK